MKNKKNLGVHVSISGGICKSFDRANKLEINTMQIFLKNSNRWKVKPYKKDEIEKFKTLKENNDILIFAHSGYLINLAGLGENQNKSILALKDELERADALEIKFIVIHPGSHLQTGVESGIIRIVNSIEESYQLAGNPEVKLLLETTAGQGSSIGSNFNQLAKIIDLSKNRNKLEICLDTCHIFTAGYDISTVKGIDQTLKEFDTLIGLDKLKLIHLNDSKKDFGSRVDRHEHIGEGKIGEKGLKKFLNTKQISHVSVILETPKMDENSDKMNLKKVKKLLTSG